MKRILKIFNSSSTNSTKRLEIRKIEAIEKNNTLLEKQNESIIDLKKSIDLNNNLLQSNTTHHSGELQQLGRDCSDINAICATVSTLGAAIGADAAQGSQSTGTPTIEEAAASGAASQNFG